MLEEREWKVELKSCQKMEDILKPQARRHHPLSDEAVLLLNQEYKLRGLLEVVARARKKTTGAMFPHEFS